MFINNTHLPVVNLSEVIKMSEMEHVIHNVKSVELGMLKSFDEKGSHPFFVRNLYIMTLNKHGDKDEFTLTLFTKDKESLKKIGLCEGECK